MWRPPPANAYADHETGVLTEDVEGVPGELEDGARLALKVENQLAVLFGSRRVWGSGGEEDLWIYVGGVEECEAFKGSQLFQGRHFTSSKTGMRRPDQTSPRSSGPRSPSSTEAMPWERLET